MEPIDFNNLEGWEFPEDRNNGCVSGAVEVVFRNYRRRLLDVVEEARAQGWVCFGAVAWLTDSLVLDALAQIPASIVVQKEDFLRPDPDGDEEDREAWRARLRRQYEAIGKSERANVPGSYFQRYHMRFPLGEMSHCADPGIAGVRCFGIRNDRSGKSPRSRPLMHNKFLVFAEMVLKTVPGSGDEDSYQVPEWKGRVLWSGSCNLSRLSLRSLETAYIFRDPVLADAHIREWAQIAALSEPLDWTSEWIDPQWRLGS